MHRTISNSDIENNNDKTQQAMSKQTNKRLYIVNTM